MLTELTSNNGASRETTTLGMAWTMPVTTVCVAEAENACDTVTVEVPGGVWGSDLTDGSVSATLSVTDDESGPSTVATTTVVSRAAVSVVVTDAADGLVDGGVYSLTVSGVPTPHGDLTTLGNGGLTVSVG